MTMAWAFGTNSSVAALMVAFRLAHLFRRLLGEGALHTAFIPQFEALRAKNPAMAELFFYDLKRKLVYVLCTLISLGILSLFAMQKLAIIGPGWEEIIFLTALLLPSLLFICLYGLSSARLQCEGKFFLPAAAPVLFNALWIIGALLLHGLPVHKAMPWMALAITIGCILQWAVTLIHRPIINTSLKTHKTSLRPFIAPFTMAAFGVAATQINSALDPLFARFANAEGPAFLWYAIRLEQLPLALFGISLSSALLPALSKVEKAGDEKQAQHLLFGSLKRCLVLMIIMTVILLVFGSTLISILFGRGQFDADSIHASYLCLCGYGIGLIPSAWILLLAPSFHAKQNYRIPLLASTVAVVVNIACNSLFVFGLGWGSASVAYATSIGAFVNCGILLNSHPYLKNIK